MMVVLPCQQLAMHIYMTAASGTNSLPVPGGMQWLQQRCLRRRRRRLPHCLSVLCSAPWPRALGRCRPLLLPPLRLLVVVLEGGGREWPTRAKMRHLGGQLGCQ